MKKILSVCLLLLSFVCLAHSPEPSHQVKFSDALITAPTTTIEVVLNSTTNIVSVDVQKVSDVPTYCKSVDEDVADVGFNIRKHSYKTIQLSVGAEFKYPSVGAENYCRDSVRV